MSPCRLLPLGRFSKSSFRKGASLVVSFHPSLPHYTTFTSPPLFLPLLFHVLSSLSAPFHFQPRSSDADSVSWNYLSFAERNLILSVSLSINVKPFQPRAPARLPALQAPPVLVQYIRNRCTLFVACIH